MSFVHGLFVWTWCCVQLSGSIRDEPVICRSFSLLAFDIGAKHSLSMPGSRLAEGRIRGGCHPDVFLDEVVVEFSLVKWLLLAMGRQLPTSIIMKIILVHPIRLADRVYPCTGPGLQQWQES